MTNPILEILLLGPPEILLEGKPVLIKRRLNRALLFYLAAQQYPVTRDEVCALFWPEEPEDAARKNLREALSRLRTTLGLHDLLISDGEQLSLNPARVRVDYREIDRLISPLMSSSEMTSGGMLPEWMVTQLKAGMALCRTERFMQGMTLTDADGFGNWLELTNQGYRYAMVKVIDRLVDHNISGGNLEEALMWLGKAFHLNPFDENWNYLTLICLRDTGKVKELIEFATYLETLYLQQQEPFPQRFSDIKTEAIENKNLRLVAAADWPEEETREPPFFGRENELEILNRTLRKRGIVLLRGEAGIGKTRLLKQFYISQPFAPRLLYCRSHPLASDVAFNTIVNPLRTQIQDGDWQALDPAKQRLLSGFYHNVLQGPESPGLSRTESEWLPVLEDVFFTSLELLKIAASKRPVLFILDDAMWMDLASISLVSFLIEQKYFDRYGMLVISSSPEAENPQLAAMLQRVRRARKLDTIQLDPLEDREVEQLAQRVIGRRLGEELVREIQRLTGGNPYFLIECLRNMKLSPVEGADFSGLEGCTPPESLAALVRDKITGLEKDSVKLLQSAAVLGREFYVDVVEEMTGDRGDKLVACIDELLREGFIRNHPQPKTEGSYFFKHDVEREVVLHGLGPARRRYLHLSAAKALEKRRPKRPEFSKEIARHYESAGEKQSAVYAWLQAGRHARSDFSKEDTYTAYGRALELICVSPVSFDENLIYDVVNEWGNYAHDRDDPRTCEHIYQCCLDAGEARHSLLLIGAGLSGLGRAADFLYEYEKAAEYFQRATFYLANTEYDTERVKALSRLGIMLFGMDDYTRANTLLEAALQLDGGGKDQESLDNRVNILSYLCFLHIFMGEPKKAGEIADEMARLSILVKRRSARVQAHALLAMTQYFNDRVGEALQTCRNTHALAENLQVRFWLSLLELVEAMAYLHTGDLDKSWQYADQAYRREANYPQEKLFMQAIKIKGDLFRSLEEYGKARSFYEELFDYDVRNYQTIESRSLFGVMHANEGNAEEAFSLIKQSISDAEEKNLAGIALKARMSMLLLGQAGGSAAVFEKEASVIQQEITQRGLLNHGAYEGWVPAVTLELRGETEKALALYMELRQRLALSGNIWAEFQVLRRMLNLSAGKGAEGLLARERVNDLLTMLAESATTPAVKGSFQKFRNKWKRYVNAVSTRG